ncbi:unnamed protein product [Closterium sp. Yama58-4]|nr:unnamed protein product [Closterium sp. Yama58-4]
MSESAQPAEAPSIKSPSPAAPVPFDQWVGSFDADVAASLPNTGIDIAEIVRDRGISKAVDVPYFDLPERVIKSASGWLATQGSKDLAAVAALLIHVELHDRPPSDDVTISKDAALALLAILLRLRPATLQQVPDALLPSIKDKRPSSAEPLPPKNSQQPPTEDGASSGSHVAEGDRLAILAWIYGQAARADRVAGMSLFIHCLLPPAIHPTAPPSCTHLALSFLEEVVLENRRKAYAELHRGAVRGGLRLVPPEALRSFLLAAFPAQADCTEFTPRFAHAYLIVKQLALVKGTIPGDPGESDAATQAALARTKSTQEAAEKLLPLMFEAAGEGSEELREEANAIVLWCLMENPACYSQWERLHSGALDTSRHMLAGVERRWEEVKLQLAPYAPLRAFLLAIRRQHAQALRALDQSQVEERATIRQTDTVARKLQRKISRCPSDLGGPTAFAHFVPLFASHNAAMAKYPAAASSLSGTANPNPVDTADPAARARAEAYADGVSAAGSGGARNEWKERRERIESLGWLTESALMPKKQRVIEGVSAGSLVSLRAELYKSQEDAKRAKEEGGGEPRVRRAGGGAEGGPGDLFGGRNAGVEERAHRDALQWKAERDVAGHLERKAAIYARLARGERAEGEGAQGEGADWAGVEEKYNVDFLRRGTLEEERQEMERERRGEEALLLGGAEGDGGEGGRDGGGGAIVVAGGGMPSTQRELIREVIEETRTARERAALLKAKRQQQAEQKREKLRAAFLKQQLLKEKAKKKDSKTAGGKNGGGEGGQS